MDINLGELLAVLKEINAILSALRDMGVKIEGTIDLSTLIKLVRPASG
jgi:hypothetical protein